VAVHIEVGGVIEVGVLVGARVAMDVGAFVDVGTWTGICVAVEVGVFDACARVCVGLSVRTGVNASVGPATLEVGLTPSLTCLQAPKNNPVRIYPKTAISCKI
jgi:hypothetical protein